MGEVDGIDLGDVLRVEERWRAALLRFGDHARLTGSHQHPVESKPSSASARFQYKETIALRGR